MGIVLLDIGVAFLLVNPIQQYLIKEVAVAQPISSLSVGAIEANRNVEKIATEDATTDILELFDL